MHDFTTHWHWPQWALVGLLVLGFALTTAQHGRPRVHRSGEDKGKPETYNGFAALFKIALWISILICGGFFA